MNEGNKKPLHSRQERLDGYVLRPAIALTMLELAERYWEAEQPAANESNHSTFAAGA